MFTAKVRPFCRVEIACPRAALVGDLEGQCAKGYPARLRSCHWGCDDTRPTAQVRFCPGNSHLACEVHCESTHPGGELLRFGEGRIGVGIDSSERQPGLAVHGRCARLRSGRRDSSLAGDPARGVCRQCHERRSRSHLSGCLADLFGNRNRQYARSGHRRVSHQPLVGRLANV